MTDGKEASMSISGHISPSTSPRDLIDIGRYPVDEVDGAGAALVERCRADLEATGACQLDGFLRAEAV